MLLSRKLLLRLLGALWLIDGMLQLQPQMFTMNMVNTIMVPTVHGQPALIAANLQWIVDITTQHLVVINLLIAIVQILLGLGLLLLPAQKVKGLLLASIAWAFIVWYGGEGMSMLLTGQASILTGAPGAVLLYPLLGLVVYPRQSSPAGSNSPDSPDGLKTLTAHSSAGGLLSRLHLRYLLTAFWLFAAFLQLQPYWWQSGQISQTIGAMVGQGGLNSVLVDPVLQRLSDFTATMETPLNSVLILVFLGLGLVLAVVKEKQLRPVLIASIIASLLLWYGAQAFGMIFTGMATDFNSGLLLVVIALACWPRIPVLRVARNRFARDVQRISRSTQSA